MTNSDKISTKLNEAVDKLKNIFQKSMDFSVREITINKMSAAFISISGMVDKNLMTECVIKRVERYFENSTTNIDDKVTELRISDKNLSASPEQIQITTYSEAVFFLTRGFGLLIIDKSEFAFAFGIQGFPFRGISEPTAEITERGSKEGFTEVLAINTTMVRRRLKTPKLIFEQININSESGTDVYLCYLTDKVEPKILEEVKKRLKKSNLKMLFSSEYLTPYLEEKHKTSLFSSIGMTERPDTLCGKLSKGRIGIMMDGTPNVLVVPYLFMEYFQNMEDYMIQPYFATFTRCLKFLSFFISILLPALYVAFGTFNPEVFPPELLDKLILSSGTTPFSLMLETLVIYIIYEIMREAGLRLPRPLGYAVSLIGGLVIGDTAVKAGLIGLPTLMVVAVTAISSYVLPTLYHPISILRFVFIIVAGFTGSLGITIGLFLVLVNICCKENFGIPYTAPISPFSFFGMRDLFIRSGFKKLSESYNRVQKMPGTKSQN